VVPAQVRYTAVKSGSSIQISKSDFRFHLQGIIKMVVFLPKRRHSTIKG
jgi:hypothetical protein